MADSINLAFIHWASLTLAEFPLPNISLTVIIQSATEKKVTVSLLAPVGCKPDWKIPLRDGSWAAGAALWNKFEFLLRHKVRNAEMPFESFHESHEGWTSNAAHVSQRRKFFLLDKQLWDPIFYYFRKLWVVGCWFCVGWSRDILWQPLPSVGLNQQEMNLSVICSWNLSGMSERHRLLHPLGWTICHIKTPVDSPDWKNCFSRPQFPLEDGVTFWWGGCFRAGPAMYPLFDKLHVSSWGTATFPEVFGNSGSHGRILHYGETKLKYFLSEKLAVCSFGMVYQSHKFSPQRKKTPSECQCLKEQKCWVICGFSFFGQWCHKSISQLCACSFLWKQYCFLKLSQPKAFEAFSGTADLPVVGLLPKRFLEAEGYK